MRNSFSILLIVCLLASCNTNSSRSDKDVINIGINLPLSGKAAYFGVELKKGLDLAWDVYNDTCRKNAINAIFDDNQLNARQAVSITRKFIDVNNTDIIIGAYTPVVNAIKDIVNDAEIPMLATIASAGNITENLNWVFRDFVLESQSMLLLAKYAYKVAGYKYGTALVVNDDFGLDAREYFTNAFIEIGGLMNAGAVFETSDMDHRTKINKILSKNPEFVLIIGRGAAMINACRQIKESDPGIAILTTESINIAPIWEGLGKVAEGITFVEIDVNREEKAYRKINIRSEEVFGQPMNWMSIYGYSIGKYLAEIVYQHGGDKLQLKNSLENLDVESIRGRLRMNSNHEVITPLEIRKHVNGGNITL